MNQRKYFLLMGVVVLFLFSGGIASASSLPEPGDHLPEMVFVCPETPEARAALGLSEDCETFTLADMGVNVLLLEIIGVYCPYCHEQAPLFSMLYRRLERSKLTDKAKMIAVVSGATPMEVAELLKQSKYDFQVIRDEDFSLHKQLGEPLTPFTMIVDGQGKVLETFTGIVRDVDALFLKLKEAAQ